MNVGNSTASSNAMMACGSVCTCGWDAAKPDAACATEPDSGAAGAAGWKLPGTCPEVCVASICGSCTPRKACQSVPYWKAASWQGLVLLCWMKAAVIVFSHWSATDDMPIIHMGALSLI